MKKKPPIVKRSIDKGLQKIQQRSILSVVGESTKKFMVGNAAGVTGILSGYPLDTLKVRLQTSSGKESMTSVFLNTLRKEKVFGLFKGVLSPVLMEGINCGILFGAFGMLNNFRINSAKKGKFAEISSLFLSGAFSGFAYAHSCTPSDLCKIRLQTDYTSFGRKRVAGSKGFLDCFWNIITTRGVIGKGSLYHGYCATCLRDISYYSIYFTLYTTLKMRLAKKYGSLNKISNLQIMGIGGFSGVVTWAICLPLDTIKSLVQQDFGMNVRTVVSNARKEASFRGVYKGFAPCMGRAFVVHSMCFLVWELLNKQMKKGSL